MTDEQIYCFFQNFFLLHLQMDRLKGHHFIFVQRDFYALNLNQICLYFNINITIKLSTTNSENLSICKIQSPKSKKQLTLQQSVSSQKEYSKMLVPKPNHHSIIIRNFIALLVCISLMTYIHFEINMATSTLEDANGIISSILKNQTYSITHQKLFSLHQSLKAKSYAQLSQAECLTRIYLDVLNNDKFISQAQENPTSQDRSNDEKVQFTFSELIFPTVSHSLEGFRNCSDVLTLMNFLNPTKTDFIYTKFMQEKYGSFIQKLQKEHITQQANNPTNFCIFTTQFNTSTTKLRQNINSVIDQSYENYRLVILDNGSADGSYQIAKVILSDLKEKLTSESSQKAKQIQQKYQILKEDSKLGLWELYKKHDQVCEGMDFVLFIDGRDSLPTRHTLSILNHHIQSAKVKPALVTSPILKRNELTLKNPADFNISSPKNLPTFTFKIISTQLLKETVQKLYELTKNSKHSFQVQKATIQTLFNHCKENKKQILQVQEIMYVYDTIENKEFERNEYFVAVVKKEESKKEKKL